nr:MAG TPA: hypothetical protein [Caudoviricetes sp.]
MSMRGQSHIFSCHLSLTTNQSILLLVTIEFILSLIAIKAMIVSFNEIIMTV